MFDVEEYRPPVVLRALAVLGAAVAVICGGAAATSGALGWHALLVAASAIVLVLAATVYATTTLVLTTDAVATTSLLGRRSAPWSEVERVEITPRHPDVATRLRTAAAPLLGISLAVGLTVLAFVVSPPTWGRTGLGWLSTHVVVWGTLVAVRAVVLRLIRRTAAAAALRDGVTVVGHDGGVLAFLPGRLSEAECTRLRRRCRSLGVRPRLAY